jgi:hypothetical protein
MSDAYVINFGTKLDKQQLIAEADAVCKMDRKREVVWDVSKFTSVPWGELGFVADIMKKIKPFAKIKIIKNKIILPNSTWKAALKCLYALATPAAPTELYVGSLDASAS